VAKKSGDPSLKGKFIMILKSKDPAIRAVEIIIAGILIFLLGLNVGNGNIPTNVDSVLNRNSENADLPRTLNYALIQQEYNLLKDQYDGKLTTSELQNGIANGLANSIGDPYTEYFDKADAQSFNDEINNSFSGIGAELSIDNGNIVVIAPISGYPAAKAGLKANDIIESINGKTTTGENVDTAVDDIRGPVGSTVTLEVLRNNTQQLTFKITRANIQVPSVSTQILAGNIGYMQILTFANDTSQLAQTAANKFKSEGVKGIILDLRDNPGGLVSAAVNVSSLWLPSGDTIMTEKHDNKVVQTYQSTGNDILKGIPTVVLINGGSASASEITAGALHDNKAATLIGQKSFGKGVVQALNPLPDGAELKVTIAHWYRPNGTSINHIGIEPDEVITPTTADNTTGNDVQKTAAINYLQSH
jgi:carboxyl-terminal processing protease